MNYSKILKCFRVDFKKTVLEVEIQGSPERCIYRIAVEDVNGDIYILEQISPRQRKHKQLIIDSIKYLQLNGFKYAYPYIGNKIVECDNSLWQLAPFIENFGLERPKYIYDQWRGEAVSNIILDLKKSAAGISFPKQAFSIKNYIRCLMVQIEKNNGELFAQLQHVKDYLENSFFEYHDSLQTEFCHGDLHPINILWDRNSIKGVIDWEFLGYKPALYDIANFAGCVGIENPGALTGRLLKTLTAILISKNFTEEKSWEYFLDLIIAIRFAWLSEWLRKADSEMIELELVYMNLLIKNKFLIEKELGIKR